MRRKCALLAGSSRACIRTGLGAAGWDSVFHEARGSICCALVMLLVSIPQFSDLFAAVRATCHSAGYSA
jgi:hypothetical protein